MSDPAADDQSVLVPSVVPDAPASEDEPQESVESPGKVMRIGSMIKQLLEEVRATSELDEPSRERLREIYDTSIRELSSALSQDLQDELARITTPFDDDAPTGSELRIAKAQLVGWLEGLFHGIQATLFAQQMAARQQLEQMQQRGLPPGAAQALQAQQGHGQPGRRDDDPRPGTYL